MSKADFKEYAEGLTDEQMLNSIGLGAILTDLGGALKAEEAKRFGILMTKEQRDDNDGKPHLTSNICVDIEVPGVMCIMLQPTDTNSSKTRGNGFAMNVGQADKKKTGNAPVKTISERLLDKLIMQLDGRVAEKALAEIKADLKAGYSIEDGKFKFNSKALAPLNNPVEIMEWCNDLSVEFTGTENGACFTSMEVVPIPLDPNPTTPEQVAENVMEIPSSDAEISPVISGGIGHNVDGESLSGDEGIQPTFFDSWGQQD